MNIDVQGPKRMLTLISEDGEIIFSLSESIVTGWIVILIIFIICKILTHNLKKVPETKRQCIAEYIVNFFNSAVNENMGEAFKAYTPYIAAVFCYILFGSIISMLGFRSVTADISTTATLAVMTFVLITYHKISAHGVGSYLKQFINPLNIISEVATPLSMALRLYGNISGGMLITMIVYAALGSASAGLYGLLNINADVYYFNIFQIGIPAVLSIYFDLFSGVIQSYIFIMLTMAYIRLGRE